MDKLECEFPINLKLIRKFFTNDSFNLLSVVKTYETYFKGDNELLKICLYLNKMMIFILEVLEELHLKSDKDKINSLLRTKCSTKYHLYTLSFDFFTEIQSIITTYQMKKKHVKIDNSDINPKESIDLKVLLVDDNYKEKTSKTHLILNKNLVRSL